MPTPFYINDNLVAKFYVFTNDNCIFLHKWFKWIVHFFPFPEVYSILYNLMIFYMIVHHYNK